MPDSAQAEANSALWSGGDYVADYADRTLRPVEVILLARYRADLAGAVLELGCGAGRLSGYVVELSERFHGLDVSQEMIDHCRSAYPRGDFRRGDMRDLSAHATGSLDAVLAPYSVLDVLPPDERLAELDELHRVLRPGGMLIASTHNLASAPYREGPLDMLRWRDPARLAVDLTRLPRRLRNRRRRRRDERREPGYAILNDVSHDFLALHYYIARSDQERQLREHGFEPLECLDLEGRTLAEGDDAPRSPELHYVGRRSDG